MTSESQIVVPVLEVLNGSLVGELSTTEVRLEVRNRVSLDAEDLRPLQNRNDQCFDQTVRNLKSHKEVPGNPFFEGLLEDIPRGFRITAAGRRYLTFR